MKALSIIGLVIGAIALLLGCYLQFSLVPAAEIAETNADLAIIMNGDSYYGSLQQQLDVSIHDAKMSLGIIVMFAGILALLLSILPAIRKRKIAWIGVIMGLISFLIGAGHGTHMFS